MTCPKANHFHNRIDFIIEDKTESIVIESSDLSHVIESLSIKYANTPNCLITIDDDSTIESFDLPLHEIRT